MFSWDGILSYCNCVREPNCLAFWSVQCGCFVRASSRQASAGESITTYVKQCSLSFKCRSSFSVPVPDGGWIYKGNRRYSEETCSSAILSAITPTWFHLGSKTDRTCDESVTHYLNYGMDLLTLLTPYYRAVDDDGFDLLRFKSASVSSTDPYSRKQRSNGHLGLGLCAYEPMRLIAHEL